LGGVSADHVLDGAGCDMSVVRGSSGEGRAVVEGVRREILRLLQLLLEGVDALPVFESLLLLLGEIDPFGC
jgi:hypothetical protein